MFGDSLQTKKQIKNIKESRKRVVKRLLLALFAVATVAAVVILVIVVAKPFKIKKIKVVTEDEVFAGDACSVCEQYLGSDGLKMLSGGGLRGIPDFFSGRLRAIENEIAFEFPQYKNVRVKLSGGTLIVTGETRGAYMLFDSAGDSVVTDRTGIVVLICRTENLSTESAGLQGFSENAPVLAGINVTESAVSSRIQYRSDISWNRLVELYFGIYADETLGDNVTVIYAPGVKNIYFYCKNNVVVNFGSAAERHATNDKLERLSAILRTDRIDLRDGTVNLSDAGRDTFRPNGSGDPDDPDAEQPTEIPLTTPGNDQTPGNNPQTPAVDTAAPPPQETPGPTGEATVPPVETPEETGDPAETDNPADPDGPDSSAEPDNTAPPEDTASPDENGDPTEEQTPAESETPGGEQTPDETGSPGGGADPGETGNGNTDDSQGGGRGDSENGDDGQGD